jgi:hypothetical protein
MGAARNKMDILIRSCEPCTVIAANATCRHHHDFHLPVRILDGVQQFTSNATTQRGGVEGYHLADMPAALSDVRFWG